MATKRGNATQAANLQKIFFFVLVKGRWGGGGTNLANNYEDVHFLFNNFLGGGGRILFY